MKNEYISTQKYIVQSPRKLRALVALAKKMKPLETTQKLPFSNRRASENLIKVIKSALANARNQGANEETLIFKEIQIGEGPRLKRGNAASRGRWHPYTHRMSHIRVVLTTASKSQDLKPKSSVEAKVEEVKAATKEVKAKIVKEKVKEKKSHVTKS